MQNNPSESIPLDFKTQQCSFASLRKLLSDSSTSFCELKKLLEEACSKIAMQYNLFYENGKPRKSTIIEVFAKSSCLKCIIVKLSSPLIANDVDALYKECHRLAVNVLVEELYNLLQQMGYKVAISTEAELEYGKADILITVTSYGLNLKGEAKELLVEVKTGNSLSLSQLFRYLLDERSDTIVVWRVRKRQILIFNAEKIKPLLVEFMRMICLRANRLLSSHQIPPCQHTKQSNYQPSQEELKIALEEFSEALVETLPIALQTILKELENVVPQEQKLSNG